MSTVGAEILLNVLALDKAFADYELFHVYLGPRSWKTQAARIDPKAAFRSLRRLRAGLDDAGFGDGYPRFRRTYIRDFLDCVLAQAEVFVFKTRGRDFAKTVTDLMAAEPLEPFDTEAEFSALRKALAGQGFKSVAEFNRSKRRIAFKSRRELSRYVLQVVDDMSARLLRGFGKVFGPELKRSLERSRVKIVSPGRGDPPCFYRYEGGCRGTLGIALQREFSENYVKGFVAHEVMPGHHLYYLLKQARVDRGESDEIDLADTYYSPENVINEGLAVAADGLYGGLLDPSTRLSTRVEKFLHRVFYNAWHRVNMRRKEPAAADLRLLSREMGYTDAVIREKLKYHTKDARYYTPVYALGIRYVEELSRGLAAKDFPRLYEQHSVNTLTRLRGRHGR